MVQLAAAIHLQVSALAVAAVREAVVLLLL
jgi:hypothetical protein